MNRETLVSDLLDEADLCRNDGATDIAILLERAAAALTAGWISVETPPDFSGVEYLVFCEDKERYIYPFIRGRFQRWSRDEEAYVRPSSPVTHYMPLPSAPK